MLYTSLYPFCIKHKENDFFVFYTKWVEGSVQHQSSILELEVSRDPVCLQQVIQDNVRRGTYLLGQLTALHGAEV